MTTFAMKKALGLTYEEALQKVPEALKTEGFGILSTIDLQSTLKAKIGVDFRRYTIFGACNPPLAHAALQAEVLIGVMLPCNVVVYEGDDGKATVAAIDPTRTMAAAGVPALEALALEVKQRLSRALDKLG